MRTQSCGLLVAGTALVLATLVLVSVYARRRDARTIREFRRQVLAILASEFPDRRFVAADDPHFILQGNARIGLDNLYKKCQRMGGSEAAIRDLVREHFRTTLASLDAAAAMAAMDWPSARPRLRPQLFPIEWVRRLSLAHRTFARAAALGFGLDSEKSIQYVRVDDLARWHVTFDEASKTAFANLELASKGVRPESDEHDGERFLVVGTGDSYDAVRVLLPSLREAVAKTLGTPFFAAVPTRGRLLLWSTSSSPRLQEHMRKVVRQGFMNDPYPLSPSTFSVAGPTVTELVQ
jgi:uncharacterized protein YtpQ (UPF0354 family)